MDFLLLPTSATSSEKIVLWLEMKNALKIMCQIVVVSQVKNLKSTFSTCCHFFIPALAALLTHIVTC